MAVFDIAGHIRSDVRIGSISFGVICLVVELVWNWEFHRSYVSNVKIV